MDENTAKIIKDKFDSLPESIKTLIMSSKYQDSLSAISRKYQLSFEQISILEKESTLVLMGLSPMENFGNILKEELGIEDLRNSQIVIDIDNQIFSSVQTLLKLMYTPEGEEPDLGEEELEESTFLPSNITNKDSTEIIDPIPVKPIVEPTYPDKPKDNKIAEESNDGLKELSPEIKDAIDKSDYTTALYNISQKHKLNVPQMGVLEEAVKGVMIGKMHPDKFGYYLQQNLKLSVEENTNLVNEINEEIFKPIRENMMLSFDRKKETDTEKNNNDAILKKAGIELGPQKEETDQTPSMEEREEILSKVEHPDNVQKNTSTEAVNVSSGSVAAQPKQQSSPASNTDPYRMPIE